MAAAAVVSVVVVSVAVVAQVLPQQEPAVLADLLLAVVGLVPVVPAPLPPEPELPALAPPVVDGKVAPASYSSSGASRGSASPTHSHSESKAQAVLPVPVAEGPQRPTLSAGKAGDAPLAVPPALAADWPDPRGFIPPPPCVERPAPRPQYAPIMTHTRIYHGQDAKFTERLATYYYLRDDARFGGWPAYLERPGDFIRFCCYLHVTETLAARGGTGDARVLWRWPIRRYER